MKVGPLFRETSGRTKCGVRRPLHHNATYLLKRMISRGHVICGDGERLDLNPAFSDRCDWIGEKTSQLCQVFVRRSFVHGIFSEAGDGEDCVAARGQGQLIPPGVIRSSCTAAEARGHFQGRGLIGIAVTRPQSDWR